MLTLRAAKGADYYERAEFAADDYYAEAGQVRGVWVGRGAGALGLTGGPEDGDLGALLDGRDPVTGLALAGTGRRSDGNVGFDLTFAAPKSVSVLAAVGDEPVRRAVLDAHAAGVDAALDYLERQACFVRRGRNGVRVLPAEGFVGALYVHEMARSGDPHLHAHLVIANRVRGPDGRWGAPDMRPVYAQAKTAGTIADAVMRAQLTRTLGRRVGAGAKRHRRAGRRPRAGARALLGPPRRDHGGGHGARAHLARGHRGDPARDARPKARGRARGGGGRLARPRRRARLRRARAVGRPRARPGARGV